MTAARQAPRRCSAGPSRRVQYIYWGVSAVLIPDVVKSREGYILGVTTAGNNFAFTIDEFDRCICERFADC